MAKKPREDNDIFVNSQGIKVPLIPISMLEVDASEQNIRKMYKDRGEPIDPPTYAVSVAGGGEKTFPLTADNLTVEGDDKETLRRKMDWATHQNALNRMQAEINSVRTALVLEGINIKELPKDGKWLARCKRLGISLPEDPDELFDFYKKSAIVRTPDDILDVEMKIMLLSTGKVMQPEEIEAVKAKFRRIIYKELEGTGEVDNTDGGSESTP